eukprot:COSAG04_NODE_17570_length_465_cov_1.661202_1_plen_155_part_11
MPPDLRAPMALGAQGYAKLLVDGLKAITAESVAKVISRLAALQILEREAESISLGCGAAHFIMVCSRYCPKAVAECDTSAIFGGGLTLLRRVCPKPLSAEWWVSTCAEVDATAVHLNLIFILFGTARVLDPGALESTSWLGPALAHVVHVCKVNA